MKGKKVIILFSGGYDSTLLIAFAERMGMEIFCLLFDYGQKHIEELEYAERFCKEGNIMFQRIKIQVDAESKLTSGDTRYQGVSEWHVPSRNLIFLAHAASIAESSGIDLIWYGANYADRDHLFPDCYQDWVYQLNKLLEINGSFKITVEAPLLGMPKELIESFGETYFEIKKNETFSGYGKIE